MDDVLSLEELEVLIKDITQKIQNQIVHHNRQGQLNYYISQLPIDYEFSTKNIQEKEGKILVIGQSQIRKKHIRGIASNLGIDANRFEVIINYDEVERFSFNKLAYNDRYDYIFVGPMPHKLKGLKDESGMIAQIENNPDIYPELVRVLNHTGDLKITKSSFKRALEENII